MRKFAIALVLGMVATAGMGHSGARAEVLITLEEAKLPASGNAALPVRGVTRGPGIEQESPATNQAMTSPLAFKIKFEARNKIAIDPATVKLVYLKSTPVDLTDRIRKHVTAAGIAMDQAEVPPGVHLLRLDLKDMQGRVATAVIKLTVTER